MPLNAQLTDLVERPHERLSSKSYIDVALETPPLTPTELDIIDDESVDEDLVKETPPRVSDHARTNSQPRPFGEVIDDYERLGSPYSPTLRHVKGRIESRSSSSSAGMADSYADAVKQPPEPMQNGGIPNMPPGIWLAQKRKAEHDEDDTFAHGRDAPPVIAESRTPEAYEAVGSDETPKSPVRRAHKRNSSKNLHKETQKQETEKQAPSGEANGSAESSGLVYENFNNKSGENLASIKPDPQLYDLTLSQIQFKDKAVEAPADTTQNNELVSGRRAGAGWQSSAIRWAPMNIPLQRRLQTMMVLIHTLCIAGSFAIFFMLCTIPLLWPILLPYLIYVLFSNAHVNGKLSHRSEWLRRAKVWSLFASYFPARLHRSAELEPTRKYIFGYHPHGIISHGAFAAFGTEALGFSQLFPGITNTLLTLEANFRIPIYRDYALRLGLASVSRESCENILSKGGRNGEGMGRAITIVVGGARESLDAKPGTLRLVLRRRKGFVKMAIRTGADLVPVLAFGENDLYEQLDTAAHPWVHKFQMLVKKFMGFTVPLFHARGVFNYDVGLMPYRRPVNVVVGKPIRTLQSSKPEPAYVDEIHSRYCDELERIWDDWKDTFAFRRTGELEVVE